MVIPISGEMQPHNPIRPKRSRSKDEDEGRFEELLVDRVEAPDEGEQGSENRNKSYWEKMGQSAHGRPHSENQAAARESQSDEGEDSDSLRGRKIDLRA